MSDHRLDQKFRQRLEYGAMPVPDELWNEIEPFLPGPNRRNRRGLIWIFGMGVLITAIAIGLWVYSEQNLLAVKATTDAQVTTGLYSTASINPDAPNAPSLTEPTTPLKEQSIVAPDETRSINSQRVGDYEQPDDPFNITARDGTIHPASSTSSLHDIVEQPAETQEMAVQLSAETSLSALLSGLQLLPDLERALPDPAKDCYSFGRKSNGGSGTWFAEVYTGPSFSLRSLSSRNEDVSAYIATRDSTESSRLSWHAGLRAGYLHHSGISLRIGGHYTMVNELFDYFDGSTTGVTIRFDTIRDAGGNIIGINADTVIVSGQRIKTTHNRFHTIDIPVLLGYQMTQGDWTYGIQAGPVLNVAFIRKGDMLSPAGVPVSFSDNAPMPYRVFEDHLGLSIYASAHLGKRIGQRTTLFTEPHVLHRLRSITLDAYPIDQRQTQIGLSIGLRLALN